MRIEQITATEYGHLFPDGAPGAHLYNSVSFTSLMAHVADEVQYYAMADTKVRAGIVLGLRDGVLCSPFSAPFGSFRFTKLQSVETIDHCVEALASLGKPMKIVLPPEVYFPALHGRLVSSLLRHGTLAYADLSYHYPLHHLDTFETTLDRAARQKLHEARRHQWQFEVLDTSDSSNIERAYSVIAANRAWRGYPLAMSCSQVAETAPVASSMMMVLSNSDGDAAAAIVHRVTSRVAQIVYWGDAPGFTELRPMNLLPFHVFTALRDAGFETVDLGPASSDGIPDYGLSVYKDSLGCTATLKPAFLLN